MTYTNTVVFIETSLFTNLVTKYFSDEEYRELQQYIMAYPDYGDIISGSGGLRKIRWGRNGMGKSGGIRIIYYWAKSRDQIYMITLYSKSERQNIDSVTLSRIAKHLENMK